MPRKGVLIMNMVGYTDTVYRYPIKGCRAISSDSLQCDPLYGIRDDRHFALISAVRDNPSFPYRKAITQRQCPQLASVAVRSFLNSFIVSYGEGRSKKECAIRTRDDRVAERIAITIHDPAQPVSGVLLRDARDDFFSEIVGIPVELVSINARKRRVVQFPEVAEPMTLGFADGKPVLVTNTASLSQLNAELRREGKMPVPMNRFRPNVVVSGIEPWEEDSWKKIRMGDVVLEYVKPCQRCVVTTIDQHTGVGSMDKEPLRTLGRIRPARGGPLFGAYYAVRESGFIVAGAPVEKIE